MTDDVKRGGGPGPGPSGQPVGRPAGPRRPAPAAASGPAPGRGGNRPASLVSSAKESTLDVPDLRLRYDDVGRGFLYEPMLGGYFKMPEPCTGSRRTDRLTPNAVRQIKGAALKAVKLGLPLRTFITFTVRQEQRIAFLTGELVLGTEIKRTLNALNEWLRRRNLPLLVYIWVAENVRDENPHVHLLTSYAVPRAEFGTFAKHVESLWGHGFAKIERVRKPQKAGGYMMKALGYTMKGSTDDQGTIIGNRYGISRSILPKYETIGLYDCPRAAGTLRLLRGEMTEDIAEIAPGVWMTRHGLAFSAGTDLDEVARVVAELARGRPHEP